MFTWQTDRKLNHALRAFDSRLLLAPCFLLHCGPSLFCPRFRRRWRGCENGRGNASGRGRGRALSVLNSTGLPCTPPPPSSELLPLLDHLSELQLFSCKSQFLKCSNGNRKRQRRNAENAVDLISTLWPRQSSVSPSPPSPLSACWCSTATGGGCWKWTMLSSNW